MIAGQDRGIDRRHQRRRPVGRDGENHRLRVQRVGSGVNLEAGRRRREGFRIDAELDAVRGQPPLDRRYEFAHAGRQRLEQSFAPSRRPAPTKGPEHASVPGFCVNETRRDCFHRQLLDVTRMDAADERRSDQIDRRGAEPPTVKARDRLIAVIGLHTLGTPRTLGIPDPFGPFGVRSCILMSVKRLIGVEFGLSARPE